MRIGADISYEPDTWFVCFHPTTTLRWLSWLALGRFKHVSAFAYYAGFKAWLIYEVSWTGTRLILADADFVLRWSRGCSVVKMAKRAAPQGIIGRLGFFCVPAIRHLIGLPRCVARPDALYQECLRNGGILIDGRRRLSATGSSAPG